MIRRILALILSALIIPALILLDGCKKQPSSVGMQQVSDSLKSAGFALDNFRPIDASAYGAQTCAAGPIGGVDTLVCEYPSPNGPAAGHAAAERWIGEAVTGAVLVNGLTLLAVADRGHADPNGKTIHKITQAYQKTR